MLSMVMISIQHGHSQTSQTADHVIEGGKVIVELIKAIGVKKDQDKDHDCKGRYADICVTNNSANSISILLHHRSIDERREMVILPHSQECSLQTSIGVWTYDLRISGSVQSIRKGDVLVESCQNLAMNIKF